MAAVKAREGLVRDIGDSPSTSGIPVNIKELNWEERCRTLREFISSYRLPLAVKLKSGDVSKFLTVNTPTTSKGTSSTPNSIYVSTFSSNNVCQTQFNSRSDIISTPANIEPETKEAGLADLVLQIHEVRKRKIILARKMTWDKRQNDYVVTGEQVEIPAAVKGWLEVVPEDGRPVEYFDTISGITSIKPKKFLVRTSTVGYQLTTEENGNSYWMPQEIKPYEVLSTGIVYIDSKKNNNYSQRNILKRFLKQKKAKKEKEQDLKYFQCFDSLGTEIMIPLIMSGVFSPVGDSSLANYDAVYEFQDLIMAFGLPVNAQLIHISTRDSHYCPKGVIRLYGTREEEMVIVSRVGADGNLLRDGSNVEKYEIPVNADVLFSRGVVKKKSTKPENVFYFPNEPKSSMKSKSDDRQSINKEYAVNAPINTFINDTPFQRTYLTPNEKNRSVSTSHQGTNVLPFNKDSDLRNNKANQQITTEPNDLSLLSSKSSSVDTDIQFSSNRIDLNISKSPEQIINHDVELPEKAPKERTRSGSILDKFSVRKVQKERAKLKELRSDDVFSRRISRSELSYQDFFNGLGNDGEDTKGGEYGKLKQDDSGRGSSNGTYQSTSSNNSSSLYASNSANSTTPKTKATNTTDVDIHRKARIQKRDLPPIPIESPRSSNPATPHRSIDVSNDSLYEHLPPAPHPPHHVRSSSDSAILDKYTDNVMNDDMDDNDGYMLPKQVQQEPRYVKRSNAQIRHKSPGQYKDSLKNTRTRKSRSDIPEQFMWKSKGYSSNCDLDIDDFFSFANSSKDVGDSHQTNSGAGLASMAATSQTYGATKVPEWRSKITGHIINAEDSFMDKLNLETRGTQHSSGQRSKLVRNMNANPNATLRSHNLRKMRTNVKDVFQFTEILLDNQSAQLSNHDFQGDSYHQQVSRDHICSPNSHRKTSCSHSIDTALMTSPYIRGQLEDYNGPNYSMNYVESEPCFRQNIRAYSVTGLSDTLFKHGDDSAISVCSRGDAGYPNESDDCYNMYLKRNSIPDDSWTPPAQIGELSVFEVSKSLRYIGMKDRVVLRFSKEQIDGSMLCTLDEKLLKEGFPELNALEVKKIMDFVRGWRPKKS